MAARGSPISVLSCILGGETIHHLSIIWNIEVMGFGSHDLQRIALKVAIECSNSSWPHKTIDKDLFGQYTESFVDNSWAKNGPEKSCVVSLSSPFCVFSFLHLPGRTLLPASN